MDECPGWRYNQTGEQPVCYGGFKGGGRMIRWSWALIRGIGLSVIEDKGPADRALIFRGVVPWLADAEALVFRRTSCCCPAASLSIWSTWKQPSWTGESS